MHRERLGTGQMLICVRVGKWYGAKRGQQSLWLISSLFYAFDAFTQFYGLYSSICPLFIDPNYFRFIIMITINDNVTPQQASSTSPSSPWIVMCACCLFYSFCWYSGPSFFLAELQRMKYFARTWLSNRMRTRTSQLHRHTAIKPH